MNGRMNLRNKGKRENKIFYLISSIMFYGYILFLFWRVFFYAYGSYYRSSSEIISYNIIPFKTIINYLARFNAYPLDVWFFNLFGNVMAFMPLGFFVPIVYGRIKKSKYIIYIGFLMSLFIEVLQIITRLGTFDVDDIILNTMGTLIGYVVYKGVGKFLKDALF
ncbi:MAG: VanZ family protein [Anaeromicrobium sp.]|jgi:glycopeptide antibiotics resistance protein|uniref:VanZ family protein n=1 Tax=Anaeromicrobium sp. TaxID=1929132 RepID=UPI0025CE77F5|nr:VanZ family protein [Anaeromicrobium sp.]MCT4594783.1 VanZ family protein [Anaeromicrobium sp.]